MKHMTSEEARLARPKKVRRPFTDASVQDIDAVLLPLGWRRKNFPGSPLAGTGWLSPNGDIGYYADRTGGGVYTRYFNRDYQSVRYFFSRPLQPEQVIAGEVPTA